MSESGKAYPPGPMRQYRGPQKPPPPPGPRIRHTELIILLSVLAIFFLLFAWYTPIKTFILRYSGPRIETAQRDALFFAALAYGPVGPDRSDLDRLELHLAALRVGGYVPIGLQDVAGLLRAGRPVPRQAVLLTFDQPRADSWRAVTHLIRSSGWKAVAFIDPIRAEAPGYRAPSSRDLRVALGERRWEIGSLGYDLQRMIPVSDDGAKGSYFTSLAWLSGIERNETIYDYRDRILENLDRAKQQFQREALVVPMAFAYPDGDFGQQGSDPLVRRLIRMALVSRAHELAFLSGALAHNTQHSDPMRLNRLRVEPEWSATDLLQRLDALSEASPLLRPVPGVVVPAAWVLDAGDVAFSNQWLTLTRVPGRNQPRLWVAGGKELGDGLYTSVVRLMSGAVCWYFGAAEDESVGVRLILSEDGFFTVQEMNRKGDSSPLVHKQVPVAENGRYQLQVARRGRLLHVRLNGVALMDRPLRLSSSFRGYAGLSLMPGDDDAHARIEQWTWAPAPIELAVWDASTWSPSRVAQFIHLHAHRFRYLSPALRHEQGLAATERAWMEWTYPLRSLAGLYDAGIYPAFTLSSGVDPYRAVPPDEWGPWLESLDCEGFLVRLVEADVARLQDWTAWLGEMGERMQRVGKALLIRLPRAMEQTHSMQAVLGGQPGLHVVRADDAPDEAGTPPVATIRENVVDASLPALSDWPLYQELKADPDQQAGQDVRREIERLKTEGEQAFQHGRFEEAVVFYSDWHALDDRNPEPLNRIADALSRLRFRDEAVDFLMLSLELDPSQMKRAMDLAEWLDALGRTEDARLWLNRYALLFPGDARVQVAQIKWLVRRNRLPEARERARLLQEQGERDLEASMLALQLAERSEERRRAVRTLVDLGRQSDKQFPLVELARAYDVLTLPDTEPLAALFVEWEQSASSDPRMLRLLRELHPRAFALDETYDDGFLSDAWRLEGGESHPVPAGTRLVAEPEREAFSAWLLGSHLWRDTFVEARVQRGSGQLWLTARQSRRHILRFGFDDQREQWFLQRWDDRNQILDVAQSVPSGKQTDWTEASLRLEVRGRAVMGFVNGAPLFDVPLLIPADLGPGRVTLEGFHPTPGAARFILRSVAAGPMPMRLAWMQSTTPEDAEEEIRRLQPFRTWMTDLAPVWFERLPDGAWTSQTQADDGLARLFARYYGYRLMPVARVHTTDGLSGHALRDLILLHDVDGLILWCKEWPAQEWIETFAQTPEVAGLSLLLVDAGQQRVQGLGLASSINVLHKKDTSLTPVRWSEANPGDPLWMREHILLKLQEESP